MPFNGSGTYVLPNPQLISGETISATENNQTRNDLATALTNCVTRDGQSPATSNLPMGGNRITNLAIGTVGSDASTVGQVQSGAVQFLTNVSGTDTITATVTPTIAAYTAGQTFRFVTAGINTGAATININGIGVKSITKSGTTALVAGDLPADGLITITYDGNRFQIVGAASGSASSANSVATTDDTTTSSSVYPTFVDANSGNNPIKVTSSKLSFVPSTGYLSATRFVGPLTGAVTGNVTGNLTGNVTGNVTGDVSGSSGSCTGNAASATVLSGQTGSAPGYAARAWVNFNGTGTVSIKASGNVSSITDGGVGFYTVNFNTAMSDANYAVASINPQWSGGPYMIAPNVASTSYAAGSLIIAAGTQAGAGVDFASVCIVIVR